MTVKPKYSSIKGLVPVASRKFTDREEFIKAFRKSLRKRNSDGHNIIVYYGVGGIGKTSLRKELIKVLDEEYAEIIWGSLDFDLPAYREEETALYYLRQHFRKKYKIQFPSFELAYSVYWQKTHPQLKISKENLPLLEEGGIVTSLVSILGEIPLIGLIPNVTKVAIKGQKFLKSWWTKRGQRELYNLPELEAIDILNRLPMFFASDLKDHLENKGVKCVLFMDTYEALWENTHFEGGYFLRDEWIRELVSQLPEVLWVISGREKLRWDEENEEWAKSIEQHLIGSLNYNDSKYFLDSCGIKDEKVQGLIICSSEGIPYYLDLAVDTYFEIKTRYEREPDEKDFARTQSEVLDRLLKYLDRSEIETLKVLSSARFWNREIFKMLIDEFKTGFPVTAMSELCRFSFVNEGVEKGTWLMHELMRKSMQDKLDIDTKNAAHKFLFDYYNKKLDKIEVKNITDEQQSAFKEAFYHGKISVEINKLYDWFVNTSKIFIQAYRLSLVIPLTEEFIGFFQENLGKENLKYAELLFLMSDSYLKQGKYNECEKLLKNVLKIKNKFLGEESPETVIILNYLAETYRLMGRFSEAVPLVEKAIEISDKSPDHEHLDIAEMYNNCAIIYLYLDRYKDAEVLLNKAIEITRRKLGDDNTLFGCLFHNLADVYQAQGKFREAESMRKKAIELGEKYLGSDHPDVAVRYNNLAGLYLDLGNLKDSEYLYKKAMKIYNTKLGPEHPLTAMSYSNLALLYRNYGKYKEAEELLRKAINIFEKTFGTEYPGIAKSLNVWGSVNKDQHRFEEAEALIKKAIDIGVKSYGPEHINIAFWINNLADLYIILNRTEEAKSLLEQSYNIIERISGLQHPNIVNVFKTYAKLCIAQNDFEKAEEYFKRALFIVQSSTPGHPEVNKIQRLMKELNEDTVNKKEEDTAKKDN